MKIHLPNSFYLNLLPMDLVYKIVERFPADEQEEAQETLAELLDLTVLRTILANLEDINDKIGFMEVYRDQYNTDFPLDWAVLKINDINIRLQESLERSLLSFYQKLQKN
jgi:hypothetical protein